MRLDNKDQLTSAAKPAQSPEPVVGDYPALVACQSGPVRRINEEPVVEVEHGEFDDTGCDEARSGKTAPDHMAYPDAGQVLPSNRMGVPPADERSQVASWVPEHTATVVLQTGLGER